MSDVPILSVTELFACYGESQVLHGANLALYEGEVVTLLGRNGVGKSTTLRAIIGLVRERRGSVRYRDQELTSLPLHRVARQGIGFCPEDRGIFASLSVNENLMLPPAVGPTPLSIDEIYELFPNLRERGRSRGDRLSGGEQQMLAIGRLLRTGAQLLLLDEPTEGLAPVIVEQIAAAVAKLKQRGYTILLVEQNLNFAAAIADRHYLMEDGRTVDEIAAADFASVGDRIARYLGV